jgi:hypothetical protein
MKKILRLIVILDLKKKFPLNNPTSWKRLSKKELTEMYKEYILEDKNADIKII